MTVIEKKKIAFLLSGLNAGGLETYLLRFLRLYGGKISATIIVNGTEKGDLYEDYLKVGVKIVSIKSGYINVKGLVKLYNFIRQEKFDTLCDMGANFSGKSLTVGRIAGAKKRVAYYGQSSHLFLQTKFNLVYADFVNWLVYKNATVILSNSQAALDFYFGKKNDHRCKVIKNGVNRELFEIKESKEELRKYFGLPSSKIIVGHTGRLTAAKNHTTILEVARRVCFENKNVVFVLAGNGTQDLPAQDGVIVLGYCQEIPKLLKTFDIFYFPSVTEGQPNSLIEAMISGLPFVASNISPIKECVPESNFLQLIDATDIELSVRKIEETIASNNKGMYCCQNWAIEEYDAAKNFKQFYIELI